MTDAREPFRDLGELLAAVCDQTASPQDLQRIESLASDAEGMEFVVDYLQLDGLLRWECGLGIEKEGSPAGLQSSNGHPSAIPAPAPLIPPIVVDASDVFPGAFSPPSPFLFGSWLFSYAAATLITGAAILGAWTCTVSRDYQLAESSSRPAVPWPPEATLEYVGRITGMADCRWADPNMVPPPVAAAIPLGQRYALASGLMEISYHTGAKVILQGPCTYEVESPRGGFLSLGKLTARMETKGEGGRRKAEGADNQKSEVRSQESPFPLPPSFFVVRTPTAIVTDLGTEFGVEVDEQGCTQSHVFVGKVKIAHLDATGRNGGTATFGAGQTVRCRRGEQIVIVPATAAEPGRFVRSLRPETTRIVEKFEGAKLGPAFEQTPPGRYSVGHGAAVYQQPPRPGSHQSRGYLRTVATDFCDCDFVFEATVDVRLDAPDLKSLKHEIFFGIGSGQPNPNLYDEITCGLAMVFVVDTGRIHVHATTPDCAVGQPFKDADDLADFAPSGALAPGRHRFQMVKRGKWLQFFVDADFNGRFEADFQTRWLDLAAVMPQLNSSNSRLVIGTGNCDTMTVRFEDLSIDYGKHGGTIEPSPQDRAATQGKGGKPMNDP